ncbi:MAG: ammonium transporter [Peptococcaceae bacterium]|jgi:Amt family ammonium transporter|nr:ammonium transporter [Peptococcaceae bacterium]
MDLSQLAEGINTVWVLLAAALVFFMEAGFAFLEAGFVRSKNSLNIVMKVFSDATFGTLAYWVVGFGVMYGADRAGLVGTSGFFLQGPFQYLGLHIPVYAFWFFQAAFAMAAASIVSGAVAERIKFKSYLVFTVIMTAVIYPVSGHWIWGAGGWLNKLGMLDFAGSAQVHAVGGFAALAAVLVLGPRLGRYNEDGSVNVMPAHNLQLAFLGTFILWFGWFGFNPGSSLSGLDLNIARIALNTNLAAAAGGAMATLYTAWRYGKADPSMAMNGALAGLVGITGGCAYVAPASAVLIGLVAGVLVVLAVNLLDRLHVDDPVGAVAVHGANGVWGIVAIGLFAEKGGLFYGGGAHLLGVEVLGVLSAAVWSFGVTYVVFQLLKRTMGIRVSRHEELEGLDMSEHGMPAYTGMATPVGPGMGPDGTPFPFHPHEIPASGHSS